MALYRMVCSQAGCKTGERAADVFLAVLSHKAGARTSGTPTPMAAGVNGVAAQTAEVTTALSEAITGKFP